MKSDTSQLPLTVEKTCYEYVLRAIGQGLEALNVQSFDIEIDGNNYVVHGASEPPKREEAPKRSSFKSILHNFRSKSQTPSSSRTVKGKLSSGFIFMGLRFAQDDIDRLQLRGEGLRSDSEGSPDPHRLSQMLRIVGAYIDHKGGLLLRLSYYRQSVTVCYRPRFGVEQTEVFTPANVYDFWVHLYKQRTQSTTMKNGPGGSRG